MIKCEFITLNFYFSASRSSLGIANYMQRIYCNKLLLVEKIQIPMLLQITIPTLQ